MRSSSQFELPVCIHESPDAFGVHRFYPMSAAFEFRADDKTISSCKELLQVGDGYPGTEINGQARFLFNGQQIVKLGRVAGHDSSHDHSVAAHEFHRVGSLTNVHIRSDG